MSVRLLLASCFSLRRFRPSPLKPAGLFAVTAAVLVVGFYCIPDSKRSVYLLPAYPFICYGIASILDRCASRRPVRFFAWFMAVLAVLAPFALIVLQLYPQPKLPVETIPVWGYFILVLPLGAGIAWMVNRHTPVGHTLVAVWACLVAYVAVGMPMILNPKSDSKAVPELLADSETQIISAGNSRCYSLNFYLDDRLRAVPDIKAAEAYPPGTRVLLPFNTDTTGLCRNFDYRVLLQRGADYRRPLGIAVRK